jgi:replicative DNA helicase
MNGYTDIPADAMSLRVPPHSVEAEQSVMGALLIDNAVWDRASRLVGADFYRREHKLIFAAIGKLVNAGKPADVVTVFEELASLGQADECGGLGYLNSLAQSVPSAAHMRRYAEIVHERAVLRRVISTADEAQKLAWDSRDAVDTIDRITTMFGELQRHQVRKAPRQIGELVLPRTEHYEALATGGVQAGWRTHISVLTHKLSGGMRPGGVYVLAARPAVGKSSFAAELGINFGLDGLPALFLSQEMGDAEVTDRAVATVGRVSYTSLQTGQVTDDGWGRIAEAADRLSKVPFYIDDQPALTLREIRAKAKSVKGLKVLVIDYLQLTASSRKDGNRNAEIEEVSRGLKALAKELGIAVIVLSQLNREVDKRPGKRPQLSDLRDSGAIEQDADVILFLWPVREHPERGVKVIGLDIAKNRQGPTGSLALEFHGDTQRWTASHESLDATNPATNRSKAFE